MSLIVIIVIVVLDKSTYIDELGPIDDVKVMRDSLECGDFEGLVTLGQRENVSDTWVESLFKVLYCDKCEDTHLLSVETRYMDAEDHAIERWEQVVKHLVITTEEHEYLLECCDLIDDDEDEGQQDG